MNVTSAVSQTQMLANVLPVFTARVETMDTATIVTPGDVISTDSDFLRGHGTYVDEKNRLIASVAGTVERVNKLISVLPLQTRYVGQVGDVVVGRITSISAKRWRVDVGGRQEVSCPAWRAHARERDCAARDALCAKRRRALC